MRWTITLLALLLASSVAAAFGQHDYELDIGDGYSISRTSSLQVYLTKKGKGFLVGPKRTDGVGPVVGYFMTDRFVFAKTLGKRLRDELETVGEINYTKTYYFIVLKENDKVIGPLSETQFLDHPFVAGAKPVDWKVPSNPDVLLPLLFSLLIVASVLWLLAVKFYWISVPAVIAVVVIVFVEIRQGRRRRRKSQPS